MTEWFIYLIRCRDTTLYTGISTDVARRFVEHQHDKVKGSRYLRGKGPLQLVFRLKQVIARGPRGSKSALNVCHAQLSYA